MDEYGCICRERREQQPFGEYQVRRTKKVHKIFIYVQNISHKKTKYFCYLRVDLQVLVR